MDEAPIIINQDKCKGCKKCVKGCPFGALEMVDKKATLVGDCRACMYCVEACPFGA
ncbi:MAG: 4Fe-4S binding protein, partial [Verrucomicrobia bacterium]|nr:4Fe-4S binding protein [Verrucomicrobiota bacterium]